MQWRTDMLELPGTRFVYSEISETSRFAAKLMDGGAYAIIKKEIRHDDVDHLTGQLNGRYIWVPDIDYHHKGTLGISLHEDDEMKALSILLRKLKALNLK